MIATALGAARLLVGFVIGYAATRASEPCPVCGQPSMIPGLCTRCAQVVHPRKEMIL